MLPTHYVLMAQCEAVLINKLVLKLI
jgi:hypothetical protein